MSTNRKEKTVVMDFKPNWHWCDKCKLYHKRLIRQITLGDKNNE